MTSFDLEKTFLALDGRGGVASLPLGPEFWATISSNPAARGTMVGVYPMTVEWPNWEMHPKGDEVLVLLSGRLEVILDEGGSERRISMTAGSTLVVPAGAWHRALVPEPGQLLGITFGEGTEHRPV